MNSPPHVAIIGSREPDATQAEAAEALAAGLSHLGCIIRTGGAMGIDHAAMRATKSGNLWVFLAWGTQNYEIIPKHARITVYNSNVHMSWTNSVRKYHPAPTRLGPVATKLMARNFGIIADPPPCDLVVAMPRSDGGGGTAQGMRIARGEGILVEEYRRGCCPSPAEALSRVHALLKLV